MTTSTFDRHRGIWAAAFGLALAALTAYLYTRNQGLQPTVFADEWYYSKMSRLTPLAESLLPSYLYLWIFGATNSCGAGYLDCARIGNLAFFIGAVPFLYLIARQYMGRGYAGAVALLSVAAPLNVYTAYFMPETTYYFGFCVLSWIVLTRTTWPLMVQALAAGTVLGAMSLVKVHALFLIPALCLYLVFASWNNGGAWLVRGVFAAALAGVVTIGVKFGLGFLLAGDAGMSLLGPFYQGAANSDNSSARLALLAPAFINGRGHLMALAMLLGLPLAILLHGVLGGLRERGTATNALRVYVLLMLGAAVGMTVLYTATLAHPGSNEGVRLHMRYYSFVLPMVWIVAGAGLHEARDLHPRLRWAIAALIGIVAALAWYKLPGYAAQVVDGPDIATFDMRLLPGYIMLALQLALLALWAAQRWNAGRLFLFTALPFSLLVGQVRIAEFTQMHRPAGHGDRAARVVLENVPLAERGQVMVVGNEMTQVMRVQFHIDHPDTVGLELRDNAPLAEYQMPVEKKWLMVLDRRDIDGAAKVVHQGPDFVLLRLPEPPPSFARVALAQALDPTFVTRVEGLSAIEPWGRWSDAKQVVFHFAQPLPRKFGLVINARAFEDNVGLPFTIRAGDASKEFRLSWSMQPISLQFETDGSARTLVIDVPKPTSPASHGNPTDTRLLGIGIGELNFTKEEGVAGTP
ncbi:hypothetical protein AB2N08_13345 [Massilia aurea]|uniref:DUF7024 domain-containing protein n=1 Tax=Massilia aurea TaxID=373040 RepID=UPI003461FCD5